MKRLLFLLTVLSQGIVHAADGGAAGGVEEVGLDFDAALTEIRKGLVVLPFDTRDNLLREFLAQVTLENQIHEKDTTEPLSSEQDYKRLTNLRRITMKHPEFLLSPEVVAKVKEVDSHIYEHNYFSTLSAILNYKLSEEDPLTSEENVQLNRLIINTDFIKGAGNYYSMAANIKEAVHAVINRVKDRL